MATTRLKAYVVGALVLASATTSLLMKQQADGKVRAVDTVLEEKAGEVARVRAENKELASLAAFAKQAPANRREELQRMRDEVAKLRNQTNDWGALRDEQRKLEVMLAQARVNTNSPVSQPEGLMEEAKGKLSFGGQLALALFEYAGDHQNLFPTNFEQAASYVSAQTAKETNFSASAFEIVYHGSRTALEQYAHPGAILLLREKQPWQTSSGAWARVYVFCDGSRTAYCAADGKFEEWEKEHIVVPKAKP